MTKTTFICLIFLLPAFPFAQSPYCLTNGRFTEQPYFAAADIQSGQNISYGQATDWLGQNQNLVLNVYYPKLSVDPLSNRPFILMIHGGGFVGGSKEDLDDECIGFARRGFVAATIDYRLGRNCLSDSLSYEKAVYRAIQDLHAAIRFAVENQSVLHIDTSWIFIGGGSAGAGTCLNMIYTTQAEFNAGAPYLQPLLGDINTSGNSYTHPFRIRGIFNNWGGVSSNVFDSWEAVPTISFHGDADSTVHIDSAYGNACVNPPIVFGSRSIHEQLVNWGVCSDLTVKIGGGHGIYNGSPAASDFRVAKAVCFFRSLFCADCQSASTTDSIPANCSSLAGLFPETESPRLHIYPNPSAGQVWVETGGADPIQVSVTTIQGQSVLSVYQQEGNHPLMLQGLSPGIYILSVCTGEWVKTERLVVR